MSQVTKELNNVTLSGIEIPYARRHPKSEILFDLTQQKVTEELGPKFKVSRDLAEFTFYVFPLIESDDIAMCVLIYDMCGFLLDDHLDAFPEDYEKWIHYLKTKYFPGTEYLEKWWQFFMKVGETAMGKIALDEFMEINIFCLSKIPIVNRVWSGQLMLTDTDLVDLRSIDSGAPHQFYLVLVGAGVESTKEIKNDPNYIGLNKQAAIHVTLINDLYSLRKEIAEDSYRLNYVYVKMKNYKLTGQDSVNKIILEIIESDKMAHIFGEKLKERNYTNIEQYVDGIYAAMNGNHYWSTICRRYNQL